MIAPTLLAAVTAIAMPAKNRVLPPFPAPSATEGCTLAGVIPGQPVPSRRRAQAERSPQIRIVRPGDRVTMDMIPDRRNIHVDAQGKVTGVTCG